jgi:arylsulfatase A-like enzyme
VPLMVRGPGLEPGRRSAMTTAPDLAPTVLELLGLGGLPTTMAGDSFGGVLAGTREEHRPFVVSSWPLYLAEGEIVTAIDSKARRIANYMPITVTTRERSLILGGPDDEPELYDLATDPGEQYNVWRELGHENEALYERALSFLEGVGTPEEYLVPRGKALDGWRRVVKT